MTMHDLSTRAGQVAHYSAIAQRVGRQMAPPPPVARHVPPAEVELPRKPSPKRLPESQLKRRVLANAHIVAYRAHQVAYFHPILIAVADAAGAPPTRVMASVSRYDKPPITRARHVAMYLMRMTRFMSLPQIGRRVGLTHHTSVMHGVRKVAERWHEPQYRDLIEKACATLGIEVPA